MEVEGSQAHLTSQGGVEGKIGRLGKVGGARLVATRSPGAVEHRLPAAPARVDAALQPHTDIVSRAIFNGRGIVAVTQRKEEVRARIDARICSRRAVVDTGGRVEPCPTSIDGGIENIRTTWRGITSQGTACPVLDIQR